MVYTNNNKHQYNNNIFFITNLPRLFAGKTYKRNNPQNFKIKIGEISKNNFY